MAERFDLDRLGWNPRRERKRCEMRFGAEFKTGV